MSKIIKFGELADSFFGKIENPEFTIKKVKFNESQTNLHKIGIGNMCLKLVENYIFDADTKRILNIFFNYFTGNFEFCEKNGLDLNKGLYLVGGIGTGKSIIFRIFKHYTSEIIHRNSYKMFNSLEIIDNVNISGVKFLEQFGILDYNKLSAITCYIDDIAMKNEVVKNYGTEINAIEELILLRYLVFQRTGRLTHFSTNIYPNNLHTIYDLRVVSRLREMCNIIEFTGKDRRK